MTIQSIWNIVTTVLNLMPKQGAYVSWWAVPKHHQETGTEKSWLLVRSLLICLEHKFIRVLTFPGKLTFTCIWNWHSFFLRVPPGLLAPTCSQPFKPEFTYHPFFLIHLNIIPVGSFSFCQPELKASPVILIHSSPVDFTSTNSVPCASTALLINISKKTALSSILRSTCMFGAG